MHAGVKIMISRFAPQHTDPPRVSELELGIFGISQMMRKTLLYTLAKASCLLSGALFYAV
jgi:hypothetical protein